VEQEFRCALTGELLRPGQNASLDHIVPVSKGGTNTPENLRWTTVDANKMRLDLSDEEFFAICRRILEHAGFAVTKTPTLAIVREVAS
jgi:hypothetical protein